MSIAPPRIKVRAPVAPSAEAIRRAELTLQLQKSLKLKPHVAAQRAATLSRQDGSVSEADISDIVGRLVVAGDAARVARSGRLRGISGSSVLAREVEIAAKAAPRQDPAYWVGPLDALPPTTRRNRSTNDVWTAISVAATKASVSHPEHVTANCSIRVPRVPGVASPFSVRHITTNRMNTVCCIYPRSSPLQIADNVAAAAAESQLRIDLRKALEAQLAERAAVQVGVAAERQLESISVKQDAVVFAALVASNEAARVGALHAPGHTTLLRRFGHWLPDIFTDSRACRPTPHPLQRVLHISRPNLRCITRSQANVSVTPPPRRSSRKLWKSQDFRCGTLTLSTLTL